MTAALSPGMTVDRYRIDDVIGAGSMGDVFLARDLDLNRKVALKILSERHRDNDELRARFVREARAVAAIAHPNVVQVFTTGNFDDRPYIAMEHLNGVDLGTDVRENGAWSEVQACRAMRDTARGLQAAAEAGLIHRDVKPSNLVLLNNGGDGPVKVTDFGLAKPMDPGHEPALTALGVVVGTPDYIAPEQARGDAIDERVDIYALGGTLYFLLTGVPPFRTGRKADDKYLKVVARHLRQPAPDPRKRAPRLDAEVAELCLRLMAKKPNDRPGYRQLIAQLGAIIQRLDGGGTASGRPKTLSGSRSGDIEPTPYVGGSVPRSDLFDGGATHGPDSNGIPALVPAGEHSPENATRPHNSPGGPGGAAPKTDDPHDDDSAPTRLRVPTSAGGLDDNPAIAKSSGAGLGADSIEIRRPKVARWLIVATALSVVVFLVGLALVLAGPMPTAAPAGDTAELNNRGDDSVAPNSSARSTTTDTGTPSQRPPEGMLLISKPDGTPWLFVSSRAVTRAEYTAVFPRRARRGNHKGQADAPATGVSYDYAVSFAETRGMRLPTATEWLAARATEGFIAGGNRLWEWVQDDAAGLSDAKQDGHERRLVRRGAKEAARRAAKGRADTTFRLARDLPK